MAEIPVMFLVEKLSAFLMKEAQLLGGMSEELEEIREELESIRAFLKDADRKICGSEGIKTWVKQVRRVAYDLEDVIDEFVLRFARRREGGGIKNYFGTLLTAMKRPVSSRDLANTIKAIKKRTVRISERRQMYKIEVIDGDKSSDEIIGQRQDHGDASIAEEAGLVGTEEKVKDLVDQLLQGAGNDPNTYISVVGMGGLGKTTLVKSVFRKTELKRRFQCFAWVTVSRSFNNNDLLKSMVVEFFNIREKNASEEEEARGSTLPSKEEIEKMDKVDLERQLKNYLQGKKFILVLDDVWDNKACAYINKVLPENSNGSKIMITSRIQSVASELDIKFVPYELKGLDDKVAPELLGRKAFPREIMPPEFGKEGEIMVKKCGGLPLAIVTLGGILRNKKTVSEWEKVRRELVGNCNSASMVSTTTILKLSYDELPFHLKPCFLYFGLFPEDHSIERNKLIRLWIAEGFIRERNGDMTMEEVGEEYMMQLIDRSMLQIGDISSSDGRRVKSCRIHDLMRDLAISISQEDEFLFKLDKQMRNENVMKPRRLSVIGNNEDNRTSSNIPGIEHLRSLVFFDADFTRTPYIQASRLRFLRVLDLEDARLEMLPEYTCRLLHLRYLSLRGNGDLKQLPRSIGRLQNLQTLDIRGTSIWELSRGIVRLRNLHHLCLSGTRVPRGIGNLRCLQTLTGVVDSGKGIAGEIGRLKELRRLEIEVAVEEDVEELYASIGEHDPPL